MIDPQSVNIEALPWLPLDERLTFPRQPAIYFAIDPLGIVQYIGMSKDPRRRWYLHHRYAELEQIGNIRIAYLFVDKPVLLSSIESALIAWFNPPLNAGYEPGHAKRKVAREQKVLDPNWGGTRAGAGRKPDWNLGRTELVRIPKPIAAKATEVLRQVDSMALSEKDAIALLDEILTFLKSKSEF